LASKAWRKKYCSRSCRAKDPDIVSKLYRGGKVHTFCAYCGTELVRFKSQHSTALGSFCNLTCLGNYLAESPDLFQRLLEIRKAAGDAPNKLEQYISDNFPQLTYTGDGSFWIQIGNRRKCPDFILADSNKLLEIWGNYWHDGQNPDDVIQQYREAGYECIVVWESDIRKNWQTTRQAIEYYLND